MCEVTTITRFCEPTAPGLTRMFLADINDIVTIPFASGEWIIEDDIILKPGKYFQSVAFREQAAGLSDELADAIGGGFKKNIYLKIPRYGNKSNQWIYNMVGTRFIALIEDFNGQVILIGDQFNPMRMEKATGATGQKSGEENGWVVGLIAENPKPCYLYEGAIIVDDTPLPPPPEVAGAEFIKLRVNVSGTGTSDGTFDGYVKAGNTIDVPQLAGKRLIYAIVNASVYQDFSVSSDARITQSNTTIDFTAIGGIHNNDWIILCFS
jgi:hypothetical protein